MPKIILVRSSDGHKVVDRVPLSEAFDMVRSKRAEWTGNAPVIQLCRDRYDPRGISCKVSGRVIQAYVEAKEFEQVTRITEAIDGLRPTSTSTTTTQGGVNK
jgi:hypothetical protein